MFKEKYRYIQERKRLIEDLKEFRFLLRGCYLKLKEIDTSTQAGRQERQKVLDWIESLKEDIENYQTELDDVNHSLAAWAGW